MERRSVIMLAAGLAAAGGARAEAPAIRGTATYRERMALPPGAVLAVALQDISRADAPAETLAEARIPIARQVPIGFALPYDPARIEPSHSYALRGVIEVDGRVMFRTDTIHPVLTGGAGEDVALRLVRAAAPRRGRPAAGRARMGRRGYRRPRRGRPGQVKPRLHCGRQGLRLRRLQPHRRQLYPVGGDDRLRPDDLHHDGLRPGGGGAGAALHAGAGRDPALADHATGALLLLGADGRRLALLRRH